jgi:hypothetical protein
MIFIRFVPFRSGNHLAVLYHIPSHPLQRGNHTACRYIPVLSHGKMKNAETKTAGQKQKEMNKGVLNDEECTQG